MDWEQIDKVLKEQIVNESDLQNGYEQIKKVLADNNLPTVDIDVDGLKKEFQEWLAEVIEKEPIPKNIKSIYFGLTTMSFPEIDNGKKKITAYIVGSKLTPSQNEDWACDTEYIPNRRYVLLADFEKIDNTIKSNDKLSGDYEVLTFNGLLNLLVLNSLNDFKERFLTYQYRKLGIFKTDRKRDDMHFGAGFDSGKVYLLRTLKNK